MFIIVKEINGATAAARRRPRLSMRTPPLLELYCQLGNHVGACATPHCDRAMDGPRAQQHAKKLKIKFAQQSAHAGKRRQLPGACGRQLRYDICGAAVGGEAKRAPAASGFLLQHTATK